MNKTLVYVHIPKCGGVTLRRIFDDVYGADFARCDNPDFFTMDVSPYRAFATHHAYPAIRQVFGDRAMLISITRDPLENFISLYNYVTTYKTHRLHEETKHMGVSEFFDYAQTIPPGWNLFGNHQCRMICGENDFETAKQKIDGEYALVGPLEYFDLFLVRLGAMMGWQVDKYIRHNISEKRISIAEVPPDLVQRVYRHNEHDMRLHHYVREQFFLGRQA